MTDRNRWQLRMLQKKLERVMSSNSSNDLRRDELLPLAKTLRIEKRHTLNKNQLQSAVQDNLASLHAQAADRLRNSRARDARQARLLWKDHQPNAAARSMELAARQAHPELMASLGF